MTNDSNKYEGFGDFLKDIPDKPIRTKGNNDAPSNTRPVELPCGCIPHKIRPNDVWGGIYCETEQQGYCNFECPHEDSDYSNSGMEFNDRIHDQMN